MAELKVTLFLMLKKINMLAITSSNCGPTLTVMVLLLISSSSLTCLSARISLQLSSRLRVPSWPRQSSPGEYSILSQPN